VKTGSGPLAELREKQVKRQKRMRYVAAGVAWLTSGAIFAGAATATVNMRQSMVEAWPKSASVYAMMGMPVNRFGLEFGDMQTRRSFNGTTPVLTISGEVINASEKHRPSPVVKLDLKNENGVTVLSEYVGLLDSVVAPGEVSTYTAHIVSPPMDSFNVSVSFESPKNVPATIVASEEGHDKDAYKADDEAYSDSHKSDYQKGADGVKGDHNESHDEHH
jgi:hypothetical protein